MQEKSTKTTPVIQLNFFKNPNKLVFGGDNLNAGEQY